MLKKVLTTLLLTLATSAFAEDSSINFLDELEALAKLQATDVLNQSVSGYYLKNVDIDQGKYPSLLHDAAIMGSLKLLKYLIKNDPHGIDYAYENGPTPLGYIAGDNQIESAEILLREGANPNDVGNTDNVFPLYSAVTSGNMKMIQLLLKYDADVHAGAYYQSPLGLTLEKNDIETLQLFDAYGFTLNSMNDELRIIVTEYLNSDFVEEEVLRILKLHGFNIYTKTEEKASYIEEYGKKIEHADVKQMLLDIYDVVKETEPRGEEQQAIETDSSSITKEADDINVKTNINQKTEAINQENLDVNEATDHGDTEATSLKAEELPANQSQVESLQETQEKTPEIGANLDNQDNIDKNEETDSVDTATMEDNDTALFNDTLDNKSIADVLTQDSMLENN